MAATDHKSQLHPGLDRSPRENWIDKLPPALKARWHKSWIYRAAKHLHYDAKMNRGRAIAVAVNAAERGCATGDLNWPGKQSTNPVSRGEMCAGVATWKAMKAYSGGRSTVNMANDLGDTLIIDLAYISAKVRSKSVEEGNAIKDKKAPGGGAYPINNEQDLRDAVRLFKIHRKKYSPEKQAKIARLIRTKAREYGKTVNLSNEVNEVNEVIDLAVVGGRTFNPSAHRRGHGGKFVNKGANQANEGPAITTVAFSSAVRDMDIGTSIDLPMGKGVVRRLRDGWQVRTGDGKYNKIFKDATEAVATAGKIIRTRFGKGGGWRA